MIKGIWALFSLIFIFHVHNHPGVLKLVNMNILQRYFTHKNIYGCQNCDQRVFEKNIYFIMVFPPILNSYYPMKG